MNLARRGVAILAFSMAVVVAQGQVSAQAFDGQRDASIRPDPHMTPGAVATSDPAVFCHASYSRSVRHTSGQVKRDIYRAYGLDRRRDRFEIDHLVPLWLGGSDTPENLWPQSFSTEPWNAEVKDRLEWHLVQLVCRGIVPPERAQRDIAVDWIAAYAKYCPTASDCPGYRTTYGGTW